MVPTMTEVLLEKKSNNNDKFLSIRNPEDMNPNLITKTIENDNHNHMIIEEADNNIERIETQKGPQTPPIIHENVELAKGPQTPDGKSSLYI